MLLAGLLIACGPDPSGETAWAVNYATVTPSADGIDGQQVWVLYADGWEKDHDPGWHQCSIVQELTGTAKGLLDGCTDCAAMYSVEVALLETDCSEGLAADERWTGIVEMGIGAVPADLEDAAPYPRDSLGWYLSFDGLVASDQGWAFQEVVEDGGRPEGEGWVEGERYTLWPAYAWEL